jgi:hypothetical protein
MRIKRPVRKGQGDSGGCGCIAIVAIVVGLGLIGFMCAGGGGGPGRSVVPFVKPTVPVVVTYRDSAWGQGKVAIFSNQTSNRLTIGVRFENKKSNQQKSGSIDLEPNGKTEIGWLEGWMFEPGETIEITHPDYTSVVLTIP